MGRRFIVKIGAEASKDFETVIEPNQYRASHGAIRSTPINAALSLRIHVEVEKKTNQKKKRKSKFVKLCQKRENDSSGQGVF